MALQHRDVPYPHWQFEDPASGDRLQVVPERGGLITGWRCHGRELLYFDQQRFADPALSVRGGIPVLFPICGDLPENRLCLPQGNFTLPQHGFARDLPWQLSALEDGRGITLELADSEASRQAYPFAFLLRLEVRLEPGALAIHTTVHNRSEAMMPFSIGLHPYFAVSDLAQVQVEGLPDTCFDHHAMAEDRSATQLARIEQGIDLLTHPSGPVLLHDQLNDAAIALETTPPWDLVVLWSEPPRPMVCLEPWTGPRQALLSGDRRLDLEPGASMRLDVCYRLQLPPS